MCHTAAHLHRVVHSHVPCVPARPATYEFVRRAQKYSLIHSDKAAERHQFLLIHSAEGPDGTGKCLHLSSLLISSKICQGGISCVVFIVR